MTQVLTPKASGDTIRYVFDWSFQLPVDVIASWVFTVDVGTVVLTQENFGPRFVECLISGGVDGVTQELTLQITTEAGQIMSRQITLLIDDDAQPVIPSTATKRQLIEMAFEEIGLSPYEFDPTAEEYNSAMRALDAICAELQGPGGMVRLGYNFPAVFGVGDLAEETYLPDFAINAMAIKLALRIMPKIGKTMSPETRLAMNQGMAALYAALSPIPNRALPRLTVRGAGGKPWSVWSPFFGSNNSGG